MAYEGSSNEGLEGAGAPQQKQQAAVTQEAMPEAPRAYQQQVPYPTSSFAYNTASAGQPAYAAAPQQVQPQKKSHAWIVALVAVVLLFVLCLASLASCSGLMGSAFDSALGASSTSAVDALAGDAVGIIYLDGTIQYDGSSCSPEGFEALLEEAESNTHIKAVVIRVDSGGGTATAGEEMSAYLKGFSKPVVVSSASTNASAAYEISSQADYIYVMKSTAIGSIGTAIQISDYSGLLEKLGVKLENITSADGKDSSYGTRELTDEERQHYQQMVDQINEVFIANVAEGRSMSVDAVRELATGMTFTGTDAVGNGLADGVGTFEDAIEKAAELGGASDDYAAVNLESETSDLENLVDLLGKDDTSLDNLSSALKELASNAS